eukprot:6802538-Prymnesium_polylepis.1
MGRLAIGAGDWARMGRLAIGLTADEMIGIGCSARRVTSQRAAYFAGLTPQHAEAVQVVHYRPGQEYRLHYDWFSPQ